jgi:predicted nucleic acid-binding protein
MDQRGTPLIVLDASITIAWLLNESGFSDRAFDELIANELVVVPAHWPVEVGNVLLTNFRRKRISSENISDALSDLQLLKIEVEPPLRPERMFDLLRFAEACGLTFYDAAYVDLARERGIALATLDRAMEDAAAKVGVALTPAKASITSWSSTFPAELVSKSDGCAPCPSPSARVGSAFGDSSPAPDGSRSARGCWRSTGARPLERDAAGRMIC